MANMLRKLASEGLWQACRLLPVQNNKVVFSSFAGKGFGDNPKAIALALLESGENLDLVWLTRQENPELPEGIRACRFGTPRAVKELSTARVWVDNSRGGAHFKKRGQFYLQTWHGFALKQIERACEAQLDEDYVNQCKRDSSFIDLIVSNSAFMTGVYRRDFWYDGEVAEFGSPRNDIFFRENGDLQTRVRRFFGLPEDRKIALYAPTFRADHGVEAYALDAELVRESCAKRFGGEWTVMVRLHPNVTEKSAGLYPYDGDRILDGTNYPDMQELLAGVDLLLTDYSSSMFDYALSGKPCIQFALDIEAYKKDRNFYFPIDDLPFHLARSNEALGRLITEFDQAAYETAWEKFKTDNGFREDGRASVRCAQWILGKMKG